MLKRCTKHRLRNPPNTNLKSVSRIKSRGTEHSPDHCPTACTSHTTLTTCRLCATKSSHSYRSSPNSHCYASMQQLEWRMAHAAYFQQPSSMPCINHPITTFRKHPYSRPQSAENWGRKLGNAIFGSALYGVVSMTVCSQTLYFHPILPRITSCQRSDNAYTILPRMTNQASSNHIKARNNRMIGETFGC